MNKIYYITIVGYFFFLSCAGTVINPYFKDMFGNKKHIDNDVVVLLDVRKLPENENTYEFKFYEPITANDPVRKSKRQDAILSYYNDFGMQENIGNNHYKIRAIKNTENPIIYYYIVTYVDSIKVEYNKNVEPGLTPFEILTKPDI